MALGILGGRLALESLVGQGGMGTVYRGRDQVTGVPFAVKMLARPSEEFARRFEREARVLASLSHPGIVRYVSHGSTDDGAPYLAMEWLDGQDLSQRLERGPVGIRPSLLLIRRIAEALGVAHARAIVHRDLKPSNIFLPGMQLEAAKVIDFGIALGGDGAATVTGVILGTAAYMAPEQASGARDVDARADVYSLGCVLFECIAGAPPYRGDFMALLNRALSPRELPLVSSRFDGVPAPVDAFVASLVAKARERRPKDGNAVVVAVDLLLEELRSTSPVSSSMRPIAITGGEQKLVYVVLVAEFGSTVEFGSARTALASEATSFDVALREVAEAWGASLENRAPSAAKLIVAGSEATADLARRAARCALAVRDRFPSLAVALIAVRASPSGVIAISDEVSGAAAARLSFATLSGGIPIDVLSAAYLDARFDVERTDTGPILRGARQGSLSDSRRKLLGRETPFVGRDRELRSLKDTFNACVDEGTAQVLVVTAPAGMGKSRLRQEFLDHVARSGVAATVWDARGDQTRAGSPFGLLAPMLRRALGVHEGDPPAISREQIRTRVARRIDTAADRERVAEFLAELADVPHDTTELGATLLASYDVQHTGDQMRRAWEDFVTAECAAGPLLVIVDDLQWGDFPSVKCIDVALRLLHDKPFMVLGFARPEVSDAFPGLWSERGATALSLRELPRKACEQLLRESLGGRVPEQAIAPLLERAAGNPFFLEELIRSTLEAGSAPLPPTVLAIVQGRLEIMEPELRLVLRAASIFGIGFWPSGIERLLGGDEHASRLETLLRTLESREVIVQRKERRLPAHAEYAFRHSVVRDAADAMLMPADRVLAHGLAGEWLEEAGERDPLVLAEHFERGGEPARAIRWLRQATDAALAGEDLEGALGFADRAINCGATGEDLGHLLWRKAEAHQWRASYEEARVHAVAAMDALPLGSDGWIRAASEACIVSAKRGERDEVVFAAQSIEKVVVGQPELGAAIIAVAAAIGALCPFIAHAAARAVIDRLLVVVTASKRGDPIVDGWIERALGTVAGARGDYGRALVHYSAAATSFRRARSIRNELDARGNVGYLLVQFGKEADAHLELEAVITDAKRLGIMAIVGGALQNEGLALLRLGSAVRAIERLRESLVVNQQLGEVRLVTYSRIYLAMALDAREAEIELRLVLDGEVTLDLRAYALAILAKLMSESGHVAAAFDAASEAYTILDDLGGVEEGDSAIRLAYVQALEATGAHEQAVDALRTARTILLLRAQGIGDADLRRSYLEGIPENTRILTLARDWKIAET